MIDTQNEKVITPVSVIDKPIENSIKRIITISIKTGFVIVLLGFIYYPVAIWMWERWFAADSYFGHGLFIPIVSLVLIWFKRQELLKARIINTKSGFWLLIFGIFLYIASSYTRIYFTSAYSLIIVITGIILYLFGKEVTRIIIFPLFFTLFMIPAPMSLIATSTLRMKLLAAHISVLIVQILGIPVLREGSSVYMSNTSVVVGDPCSGLKSLISLSALAVLYLYIIKASYFKKFIIFLISIPIAIIANIIRTTATILIANHYGNEIIENDFLHKGFGLMVFIIAFMGLFLVGRILGCQVSQRDT
jgi:exosortase